MSDPAVDALRDQARGAASLANFLLEDYKLITESMLRNEESGEKRAAFFMALAGAAGTALSFAFTGDSPFLDRARLPRVAAGAAAVLLLLGLMTIRRMAERHVVTDRHLFALRDIRRTFISPSLADVMHNAYYRAYEERKPEEQPRTQRYIGFHKGGWMECVAAVNAFLAGAIVAGTFVPKYEDWRRGIAVAAVSAFVMWMVQIYLATKYVTGEYNKRQAYDEDHRRQEVAHEHATQLAKTRGTQ
jgi:hypothetical protein